MVDQGQVRPGVMLLVDDDADDRAMAYHAHTSLASGDVLVSVEDGESLLAYCLRQPPYNDLAKSPRPDLILLDLNIPGMEGREALEWLKRDSELRRIPVIMLTVSRAEVDAAMSYDLGAASYIVKPTSLDGWMNLLRALQQYWFRIVRLPPHRN